MPSQTFAHRTAASLPLTLAFGGVLVVETVVVHLLLYPRFPTVAIGLLVLSLLSAVWMANDYRAFGRIVTELSPTHLTLRVAKRASAHIPRDVIISALQPSWKDIPEDNDSLYLNASAPAEANVLLTLRAPTPVRMLGMFNKQATRVGVCFDEPEAFLAALDVPERAPAL